ncbi:ArnT family glycosyltransferase [Candidatus Omnitrophota bacterium]
MLENRKDTVITICLFCLAFVIRILLISKGPFHMDVLELARNANKTLSTFNLHYMHWAGYPLTVILGSIFIFLTRLVGINDPVFSVNFMGVIFGSLSVGIFYIFSRKILDKPGALLSSLILCFLPLHIYVSTIGLNHSVSIFFNLTGLYFLFLYLEKYKLNKLILSSLFLGLGAASRLTDGLIIFSAIFLYLLWSFRKPDISRTAILKRLVLFLFIFGFTIFIFYMPMFLKSGISQFRSTLDIYYYYHSLKRLQASSIWIVDIIGIHGVILFIAGLGYFLLERKKTIFYFLLIWFLILFIYYGSHSTSCYRFLFFSIIPLLIMQGYYISKVFRRFKLLVPLLILVWVVFNFIEFFPIVKFRHNYNLQGEFARFVQKNTEPGSYVIAMDEGPFIEYYAGRKILYKATGPNKEKFDIFFSKVDKLLDESPPIYIISSGIYSYDPKKYFINTLSNNYNLDYIGKHINQDWYNPSIYHSGLFIEELYKVEKKII